MIVERIRNRLSGGHCHGTLESPKDGGTFVDTVTVVGWVFSKRGEIDCVEALLDGALLGTLECGGDRPDVAAAYDHPNAARCGYSGVFAVPDGLSLGEHLLDVCVKDGKENVFEEHRRIRRVRSPIETWLDIPAEGTSLAGVVEVVGWAFSREAPIAAVEASVDGVVECELRYGEERSDVVATFSDEAPLHCGYRGQLALDSRTSGAAALSVRITDARGNQRTITRSISVRTLWPRLWVDLPEKESVTGGTLPVQGWAFSRGTRIVDVQAWLGDRAHTVLAHGFYRPDVVAAYKDFEAERSGFEGVLNFDPRRTQRTERLVVRARDERGAIAGVEIPIRIVMPGEPLCEIERARWCGNRLQVDGWMAWPQSAPPRKIWVSVGEALAGETSPNRSRPDLRGRFPAYPAGSFRGFHLAALLEPLQEQVGVRSALVVDCVDGKGRRIQRTTRIVHEPHVGAAGVSGTGLSKIEEAVASVRDRLHREPTILDWCTGLDLGATFPHAVVFSPPGAADQAALPYLDASIDVVVVQAGGAGRRAEARRVAAIATVELYAESEAYLPQLSWESAAPAPQPFVTASIIIPVHNQATYTDACLKQLMATLPADFRGEIVVIDDASTDETATVLRRWVESSPLVRVLKNTENCGFLQSCNRAADASVGDMLVFLNNDTLPQPGWLPPLLRLLCDDPSAGAVGGKLLYPDGTLQEAGGVIFSDASGYNFGRHDGQPNRPPFNHVREVDYCSGALLAIRRSVFRDIGGFDIHFSPAYYEDTDLCFRLREKGYRVYYQPASAVVHFEGATSGTNLQAGVKRYQTVNREKFAERWRAALEKQFPPPAQFDAAARYALSTRPGQLRALICAPRMPEFDRESGSQRLFHLIEFLQEAGWAVSFVAMESIAGDRYVRLLQQRGVATYAGPDSLLAGDEYLEDVDELIANGRFDLALLAFWNIAERLLPRFRSLSPATRVIIDSVDLHFLRAARGVFHRSPGHERGALGNDYGDRMTREMNAYAAADAVLTVSRKEANLINDMVADAALAHDVPDMEDLPRSPLPFHERSGILFIGNFRHPPNLEGLKYLCAEIIPRLDPALLAHNPLYVVGNELDESVRSIVGGLEHVKLVGWVPSLVPYLERVRVSVIPLLHGAGTKRKLIQALMVGTPSVSTPIGIEGLGLVDREHVLVADNPADFAAQLERLVGDASLWRALSAQGRAHIERTHGREAVRARLQSVVDRVMNQPPTALPPS